MDKKLIKMKELGCDVEGALERLLNDEEFLLDCAGEVVRDDNFALLKEGLEEKNLQKAFDAAHTLKGICGNTGLTPLCDVLIPLVEELRAGKIDGLEEQCGRLHQIKRVFAGILQED